jgi:hypothetical protein
VDPDVHDRPQRTAGVERTSEYVPVVVQGSGVYQVTTSIPVQVAPDNYSYVPVGPDTPVTYSLGG